MTFTEALKSGDSEKIRRFPKADLHNHFVLGGSRDYIFSKTGYEIKPITKPLDNKIKLFRFTTSCDIIE